MPVPFMIQLLLVLIETLGPVIFKGEDEWAAARAIREAALRAKFPNEEG